MKKLMICCIAALAAGVLIAEGDAASKRRMTGSRFGGILIRPGTMKGKIVIGNAQTKVSVAVVEQAVADFKRLFTPDIEIKAMEKPSVAGAAEAAKASGGQVALFLVEDAGLPTVLDAPEAGWVMVNVVPLAESASETAFAKRVRLEVVRGLAMVAGAHSSSYAGTLMGAVKSPSDLDKMDPAMTLPVDVASRFMEYLKAWGVTQGLKVQYRQACREGWAPPPTNDVQKAIWERVHSEKERGPSHGLKISP